MTLNLLSGGLFSGIFNLFGWNSTTTTTTGGATTPATPALTFPVYYKPGDMLNPNIPFGTSFEPPLPCDILMMTTG